MNFGILNKNIDIDVDLQHLKQKQRVMSLPRQLLSS